MNNDKNKQQSASFSLQNEIKKRRTQEIQRAIENKQVEKARGEEGKRASQVTPSVPAPDPRRASQTIQPLDPRRASQSTQAVDPRRASQTAPAVDPRRASQSMQTVDPRRASQTAPAVDPRRSSQTMKAADPRRTSQTMQTINVARASQTFTIPVPRQIKRRQALIVAVATIAIVAVCLLTSTIAFSQQPPPRFVPPLENKKLSEVITYLKDQGMTISSEKSFSVDKMQWAADQLEEVHFQHNGKDTKILFLSYSTRTTVVGDAFNAKLNRPKYKDWTLAPMSNILVAVSPEADPATIQELQSHLTSFLLQPYHAFLPSPTPRATVTPAPTEDAG